MGIEDPADFRRQMTACADELGVRDGWGGV